MRASPSTPRIDVPRRTPRPRHLACRSHRPLPVSRATRDAGVIRPPRRTCPCRHAGSSEACSPSQVRYSRVRQPHRTTTAVCIAVAARPRDCLRWHSPVRFGRRPDRLRARRRSMQWLLRSCHRNRLLVGAASAALGMAVVAVLVLRAVGEWRELQDGEQ